MEASVSEHINEYKRELTIHSTAQVEVRLLFAYDYLKNYV